MPTHAGVTPEIEGVTYAGPKVQALDGFGDVRSRAKLLAVLPQQKSYRPRLRPPGPAGRPVADVPAVETLSPLGPLAPAPGPIRNFAGLSRIDLCNGGSCGGGWPPDPNGDVGPNHYIQAVNSAYAIYDKTGTLLTSFTENELWAGAGSSVCNGNSQGDPVVLYDALADRWILTHLGFSSDAGPFYQCIAASKTSDPVAGGWWFYPVRMDPGGAGKPPVGALNDYPKFGIWNDCLYMSANEFGLLPTENYVGTAFASFSRSDLYSGAPLTWSLGFLGTSGPFTMIPSNLSGKAGLALAAGTPNYFVSQSQTTFAYEVRKFTPGPNCGDGGTLSAATNVSQAASTSPSGIPNISQPNTTVKLDNGDDRLMQKVQYRKVGGVESLWVVHNVQTSSFSTVKPQWAQIDVTGQVVATTPVQQQIYAPDTTLNRWMGSLAVDGQGNMALGYSTSNATSPNFPGIAYSGRLASDPLNTLPQTETQMIAGAGSQTNNCGGGPCNRWGDYTAMSVDPVDDCTFWYTNEYYDSQASGTSGNWHTRIGAFNFPSCAGGAAAPTVTTTAATAIAASGATLKSTVSSNGATTTVTFRYGTTTSYGSTVAVLQSPLPAGATNLPVSATITGLSCNTLYHYRAVAVNSVTTTNGLDATFKTAACPPTAATAAATALAVTGATLNGTVSGNGASTTVTFQYGPTAAYGSSVAGVPSPLSANASAAPVSAAIIGLACNTVYHFRVVAVNSAGTTNAGDATVTTTACPPTVATGAATAIAATGATLNGTVGSNGASTTVTFQYGLTAAYGSVATAAQSPLAAGASGAAVSAAIAGLACNTPYHFRAVGGNSASTTNGRDATFTSAACPLLNVAVAGGGTVASNPAGIDCGAACSASFGVGANVTLLATPSAGSAFTGWSGACGGTLACALATTADRGVTATFTFVGAGSAGANEWMQKAYVAYYGRPADPAGLAYWANRMDMEGGSLASIIGAFGTSGEFSRRYGGLSYVALVTRIYQQTLGRDPEQGGLDYYVGELQAGRRTLQSITLDVLNGATGLDALTVANRLGVANHYTGKVALGCPYGGALTGAASLSSVSSDSATAWAAKLATEIRCGA